MLETIVEQQIVFYFVGAAFALGIASKVIAGISLKRLVRAASNMSKSNHALMRLVRAKFEHACMVSDKVQNVGAFVEKYLYEYRTVGIRLHSWRRMEKMALWLCGAFSALGAGAVYYARGAGELLIQCAVLGGGTVAGLILIYTASDEEEHLNASKMYMVDFLENTYAHRYAKTNQKEIQVMVQRTDEQPFMRQEADEDSEEILNREISYQNWQEEESAREVQLESSRRNQQAEISGREVRPEPSCRNQQPEIPGREAKPEYPYRNPQPEIPYRDMPVQDIPPVEEPVIPDPMVFPQEQPQNQPGQERAAYRPEVRAASSAQVQGMFSEREEREAERRTPIKNDTAEMREESLRKERRIREILEEFLA